MFKTESYSIYDTNCNHMAEVRSTNVDIEKIFGSLQDDKIDRGTKKIIKRNPAIFTEKVGTHKSTLLHAVALSISDSVLNAKKIIKIAKKNKVDIRELVFARNADGNLASQEALYYGNINVAEYLIKLENKYLSPGGV